MKRVLAYLAAPLVCLATWWRVPFLWFRDDDFAWLMLPQMRLWDALFQPAGPGHIRVFSERMYFLALSGMFGLTTWPYRVMAMGGWFIDLALIQWIGTKLTGSRAAGLLAACLWTVSVTLATALGWSSDFNQIFISFLILAAFAARLKGLRWLEAVLYLMGFGVLEIIVMYPALVILHSLTDHRARARWREALWMLVPAGLFTALHLFVIPKTESPIYQRIIDGRIPATLWQYIQWTVGPSQMQFRNAERIEQGLIATWIIAVALAMFATARLAKRDLRPLLFIGWFLIWLAPVLPLPNHVSDYYLTVPGIGLAWLAGWGLVSAWRSGWMFRVPAFALAAVYMAGSYVESDAVAKWYLNLTSHGRIAVRGMEVTAAAYPGKAILLTGMDSESFLHSAAGGADHTLKIEKVWLAPDQDDVLDSGRLPNLQRFRVPPEVLLEALKNDEVRVLDVEGLVARDITARYRAARIGAGVSSWSSASLPK